MTDLSPQWVSARSKIDQHVAFRLTFTSFSSNTQIRIRHAGASWYNLFVDGDFMAEGPTRFTGKKPYFDEASVRLPEKGEHVVAIHAHNVGEQTRILLLTPPFVMCQVDSTDPVNYPISTPMWRCKELSEYTAQWRRMSPLLGWMEKCLLTKDLQQWTLPQFAGTGWASPTSVEGLSPPVPLQGVAAPATSIQDCLAQVGKGVLWERYGYADDDPAARFNLRDLGANQDSRPAYGDPQGLWWRFDAKKCQLLRPVITIIAPAGIVVEVCYCQALIDGKASPYHPLCGGPSCYVDRYTVDISMSNQPLRIVPLEPRGCRYIEMHALCDDNPSMLSTVRLVSCEALQRCYSEYHAQPIGAFSSNDMQLAQIWNTGSDSTRSCVEDCCIDGPCRERGQWLGDSAAVTLPNLVFMYNDISPIRLLLQQTAEKADTNGVFSGNCPEGGGISDYALIWFSGLDLYTCASGDTTTAKALFSAAQKCMDYFLGSQCYKEGIGFDPPGLGIVIDWGYIDNHAFDINICLNAMLVTALAALVRVAQAVVDERAEAKYNAALTSHKVLLKKAIGVPEFADVEGWVFVRSREEELGQVNFVKLGFHASALLLKAGVFEDELQKACCEFLLSRLNSMFPISQNAPRLSDPRCRSTDGFYTPYFQTFTFAGMLEAGFADDVLHQIKQAWGWALTQSTTWLEVFDPRWEAVHSWGGCPTWQMSQYWLGLSPRFDQGPRHFELALHVGEKLPSASGQVPSRVGEPIEVSWTRVIEATNGVQYSLTLRSSATIFGWPTSPKNWVQLPEGKHTVVLTRSNYL